MNTFTTHAFVVKQKVKNISLYFKLKITNNLFKSTKNQKVTLTTLSILLLIHKKWATIIEQKIDNSESVPVG